jgi:SP family general alpha glucoside:H+ symporter-like MFS transporter
MVWILQACCGQALTGYAAYFSLQAGFAPETAFDLSTGMYDLAILGGIISMFAMRVVGRRTMYSRDWRG